jgi:tRNA1(Val) A37 N6-methylase TrmN6
MLNEHVTIHADEAMMWSADRLLQFHIIAFHRFFKYVTASSSTYISNHFQDKIEIREGSWFEPLKDMEGKLAGLVSNPPYIPSNDISGLQAEVGKHEPRVALDGGIDGMDALLHLCDGADLLLKSGGFFAFEVWPLFIYYYKVLSNLCVFLIVLLLSPYQ